MEKEEVQQSYQFQQNDKQLIGEKTYVHQPSTLLGSSTL
jgi:hypothetical protein